MIFYFISAPCGSGKTHQFINRAIQWANSGRKIIIFLPTKELIEKTIEHFLLNRPDAPHYKVFHGDVVSLSVSRELTDYLKQKRQDGQIVFTTHAVLPYLPHLAIRKFWQCFIDEVPQVFQHYSYVAPDTNSHEPITDLITLENHNAIYAKVKTKRGRRAELRRIAKDDGVDETIRDIAQTLLNKHWHSFVKATTFQELKDGEKEKLSVFSIMMPTVLDGFSSVTMAAANFQDSFVYQLWSRMGVEFTEDKQLASSLLFQEHPNGHLITIKYATEKNWSKKLRRSKLNPDSDDETTIQDAYVAGIKAEFPNEDFCYQANKDVSDGVFGGKAQRLPNVPHGLNTYSHINNIAFLSSLNPHPDVFPFLKTFGIDGEAVRRAIYYQTGYQSILRTSIRDPNNHYPKIGIVPDRGLAEYLNGLFLHSTIEKLNTNIPDECKSQKIGRPTKYRTDNERKAEYRQRQKQTILNDLLALQSVPYNSNQLENEKETQSGIGDKRGISRTLYTHFVADPPLTITVYKNKNTNIPTGYVHRANVGDFIFDLNYWHSRERKNKEDNFLISPAIFDPNHPNRDGTQRRGRNNIRYLQHLWLDFEHGDLKPNDVAKLFPHLRLVIFNTYNHTAANPRFRVVIPTVQRLTPEAYEILWDNIAAKLEEAGYSIGNKKQRIGRNTQSSGLDRATRTPTALFYAPCQSKNPDDSFFIDCNGPERQLLDPGTWIENSIVPFRLPFVAEDQPFDDQQSVNQAMVDKATNDWRVADHREGDNHRFWLYALTLRTAGMSLPEIERTLHQEVQSADKPIKRRTKMPSIMSSLKQSGRKVA